MHAREWARCSLGLALVLLGLGASASAGAPSTASVGGPRHADGTELDCDLPERLHRRNTDSPPGSGIGCCVFTSLHHAAHWQYVPALMEFPAWLRQHRLSGGGHPQNVQERIARLCRERSVPVPGYLQVEGGDLEVLKLACRTGRMPSVTYYRSPTGRYGGQRLYHMVNLVHASDRWFVVLDNNYPGAGAYEWLTPAEFRSAYTADRNAGWAIVLLAHGPPPVPRNR